MPDKHIAIACPACGGTGSVASIARWQARELSRYFRITLISDTLPDERLDGVDYLQVAPRRFDYLRRFCHAPNEYALVKAIYRRLAWRHETDPIHMVVCHTHALACLAAVPLQARYRIPYAMVTHGDIFDRPPGTYDYWLTRFYKWVTPGAYQHADLVITLSPYMAQCALRGGAKSEAVKVVPNGVDLADIGLAGEPAPMPAAVGSTLTLLYIGRLAPEKGVDVLLGACRELADRGVEFHLRLIGSGIQADHYRQLTKELELGLRIEFVGSVPRQRLGAYYRASDIVCVPSLNDPLPTVVLEALAAGCPVVGSDVGGIPFMVKDGVTGAIVPGGSSSALADRIHELARNPEQLREMGNRAAAAVFPRFSWDHIGVELAALINETVSDD